MQEHRYKNSMVSEATLKAKDLELDKIISLVFERCLKAGYIQEEDIVNNTKRYQWLDEVIDRNISTLSLLETIIIEVGDPTMPNDIMEDIDKKAEKIIENIAARIINSELSYPLTSCESKNNRLNIVKKILKLISLREKS